MRRDEEIRIITTERELEEFKNHCERLIMYLGLRDWDCVYIIREADDRNAGIEYNPSTRKALFILASNREEYKTLYELAKHEVLELLLADLCTLLGPFYSDILIDNETHKVINRLVFAID